MLATVLFISAGNPARTCLLGALAMLTGQLSIGWSNDLIDRERDIRRGPGRQAAGGRRARRAGTLRPACVRAVVLTVPASLALGWRAGAAAPGRGRRRLGLQPRPEVPVVSPLPYLFAFGALPVIATLALPQHRLPPAWWVVLAAGLIGAAAHFANVLPDLADDLAAGVRGLPQRLGQPAQRPAPALLTPGRDRR